MRPEATTARNKSNFILVIFLASQLAAVKRLRVTRPRKKEVGGNWLLAHSRSRIVLQLLYRESTHLATERPRLQPTALSASRL